MCAVHDSGRSDRIIMHVSRSWRLCWLMAKLDLLIDVPRRAVAGTDELRSGTCSVSVFATLLDKR